MPVTVWSPELRTVDDHVTTSPARPAAPAARLPVCVIASDGAATAVGEVRASLGADTRAPAGVVPVAVAMLVTEPRSTSAWRIV